LKFGKKTRFWPGLVLVDQTRAARANQARQVELSQAHTVSSPGELVKAPFYLVKVGFAWVESPPVRPPPFGNSELMWLSFRVEMIIKNKKQNKSSRSSLF